MVDELACRKDGRHEFRAINDCIETRFQETDQRLRRVALAAVRLVVDLAELFLRNVAVVALQLLLGAQLDAIIGQLALASLAMLARAIFAAIDRGFRASPDIFAHTAIKL